MDKFVVGQLVRIKTNEEHLRDKVWVVRRVLQHDMVDIHSKGNPDIAMIWAMNVTDSSPGDGLQKLA